MAKLNELLTLTPSESYSAITSMQVLRKRAMFLWGPPGISKSEVAMQVANDLNYAFIDLRLSQMAPEDLRGIPYPTKTGGVEGVRWSTPYIMPKDLDISILAEIETEETVVHFGNPVGSNGIHYCTTPLVEVRAVTKGLTAKVLGHTLDRATVALYDGNGDLAEGKIRITVTGETFAVLALEEFNSAPPSVQAASYQLVLDRALGEYKVPNGVFIIGMGNRDTDKGVTYKMGAPIANRFAHVEMRPDFDDWQRWAIGKFVHADVIGYLSAFKHHMFDFDPGTASRGFATPRSWVFVSDILKSDEDMSDTILLALIIGCVGDGIGIQFNEFRKIAKDLPKAEDILSGKVTKMTMKEAKANVSLSFALTTTLCYELKARVTKIEATLGKEWKKSKEFSQWLSESDMFLRFCMDNFQHEICVMGAKAAIQIHRLPFDTSKMKSFDEFTKKFKGLLLGA